MPVSSSFRWNDTLKIPSYVQASQTVIYAPQYYFGSGSAHSPSFLPTVVTFPATPNGQTSFTTYICYSTTTAAASSGANLTSQCPLPLQVQTIANEMSQVPPPLSTYRFPSPLATAVQHNKISEIVEGDDINNVSASDTTECFNSGISEVELPTVSVPVSSDESLPTSNQLVRRTAVPTHANARNTKAPRDTRGDKLPVTPQSILLMRRFSNCIQPYQPKASPPSEPPAKRAKKSKAKHCCKLCDQSFTRAHDLKRHNTTHESYKAFPCPYCSKAFGRKDALTRHIAVRGTSHNDFTKKASSKKKTALDGLPKIPRKMTAIPEEIPAPTPERNRTVQSIAEQSMTVMNGPTVDATDAGQVADSSAGSCFDISESQSATESSSRASSVYMSVASSGDCDEDLTVPQPFNIDRKSSLVQGLPSAHLHLDDADLLHPFIDPFTPTCGL